MNAALVLDPGSPEPPFEELRAALEEHLFLHRAEASKRARSHSGILARRSDSEQLEALRETLAKLGSRATIVADDEISLQPRARRATALEFDDEALIVSAPGAGDERVEIADVVGAHVWALEPDPDEERDDDDDEDEDDEDEFDHRAILGDPLLELTPTTSDEDLEWETIDDEGDGETSERVFDAERAARTLFLELRDEKHVGVQLYLTIYARFPARAFCFRFGEISFAGLGPLIRSSSHENFLMLLSQLVTTLPAESDTASLDGFLESPTLRDVLHPDREEVVRFDQWYLLWTERPRDKNSDGDGA